MIESTVIMSCYKSNKRLLKKSILSILNQSYKKFEFLIVQDGPDSDLELILKSFLKKDKRIRIIKNKKNMGLPFSLNKAIKISKGKFIIRADDDDISMSNRIELQINFLKKNKNIDILGTNALIKCLYNKKNINTKFPYNNYEIEKTLNLINPIIHSSVCCRKKIFRYYKYDVNFVKAQDYDLWLKLMKVNIKFCILPYKLVTVYKFKPSSFKKFKYEILAKIRNISLKNYLMNIFFIPVSFLKILILNSIYKN